MNKAEREEIERNRKIHIEHQREKEVREATIKKGQEILKNKKNS